MTNSVFLEKCEELDKMLLCQDKESLKKVKQLIKELESIKLEGLNRTAINFLENPPGIPSFQEIEEFRQLEEMEKHILEKFQEIAELKEKIASSINENKDSQLYILATFLEFEISAFVEMGYQDYSIEIPFYTLNHEDFFGFTEEDFFEEETKINNTYHDKLAVDLSRYFKELKVFGKTRIAQIQPNKRERESLAMVLGRMPSRSEAKELLDTYCKLVVEIPPLREQIESLRRNWSDIQKTALEKFGLKKQKYRKGYKWVFESSSNEVLEQEYIQSIKMYKERISRIDEYKAKYKSKLIRPSRQDFKGISITFMNWKLLEEHTPEDIDVFFDSLRSQFKRIYDERLEWWRIESIREILPDQIFIGENKFDGYICFIFDYSSIAVLEKPVYGHATYFLPKDHWEELSKLKWTKTNLRSKYPEVRWCIHKNRDAWIACVKHHLEAQ
uniref:Uncharacterized protein n=1 Tax=Lyngbya confervoides BDU141951 TaxID=1574623 RepID=A0A8T6QRV7_9CYAN